MTTSLFVCSRSTVVFITGTADSIQGIQSNSVPSHQNSLDMGLNTSYLILSWQLMMFIFVNYFIPQRTANLDNCCLIKVICKTTLRDAWSVVWKLQTVLVTKLKLLLQVHSVQSCDDTFKVTLIIPENFLDHFLKTIFVHNISYHGNCDGSDDNGDHDDNDNNEVNYPHAVVSYLANDWLIIN